jgi:hypothetical protein
MERRRASVERERYAPTMTSRGVTVGTLAGFAIISALIVAVLFGVGVPVSASAGAYKCEDRFLDDIDEMQLRAAALQVLPKSTHLDAVAPCRNPDSAHARISTKKILSIEGVQQWYEFTCSTEAQPWKCAPPEFKQVIPLSMTVGGVSRLVALSFDKEFSFARARTLPQKALEIYADSSVRLPQCDLGVGRRPDLENLRNGDLPPADTAVDVNVNHEGDVVAVWLRDLQLEIQFPNTTAGANAPDAPCWNMVIVTA